MKGRDAASLFAGLKVVDMAPWPPLRLSKTAEQAQNVETIHVSRLHSYPYWVAIPQLLVLVGFDDAHGAGRLATSFYELGRIGWCRRPARAR